MSFHMNQVFSSLQGHLHFFGHFSLTFMEYFFFDHPIFWLKWKKIALRTWYIARASAARSMSLLRGWGDAYVEGNSFSVNPVGNVNVGGTIEPAMRWGRSLVGLRDASWACWKILSLMRSWRPPCSPRSSWQHTHTRTHTHTYTHTHIHTHTHTHTHIYIYTYTRMHIWTLIKYVNINFFC